MPRIAKELGPLDLKKKPDLQAPGYHPVGGVAGLNLQVSEFRTKSWVMRCTVGGKRREIGFGAYPGVGLALALDKADVLRESPARRRMSRSLGEKFREGRVRHAKFQCPRCARTSKARIC